MNWNAGFNKMGYSDNPRKWHKEDPLELMVGQFLTDCHVRYIRPDRSPTVKSTLDFYLPDFDVSIEVKSWNSERLHDQIKRSGEDGKVIVLIGMQAVKAFIRLCSICKGVSVG
jgi:hypothetical protein